uniref:Retrotransposon protein, putative, Ty1-copia subclass n=1 Tax=Tanacetum cinerariifolium TaxID=118510 RepID=A0A6L2K8A0_TANCI|nr:hypothetical protein [Tanacetum cinerariifolium]
MALPVQNINYSAFSITSDFAGFVRNYNMHNMGKTVGELYALLIEYEKCLPKKAATLQVMAIQGGRIPKANKKSQNAKGNSKGKGKGKDKFSKNDVRYFNAISSNGAYEIDMINRVSNVNSIYTVSNKRSKHNLDSTYLWHCRLDHISKKRIKKLQYDGLLKSLIKNLLINMYLVYRVWDCEALVKRDMLDKLQQRSVKCIFMGYPNETMGYYFYFTPENKIVVARFRTTSKGVVPIRRPARTHRAPDRLCLNIDVDAMNAEIQSIKDNQVWRLIDLPPNSIAAFYDYEILEMDVKTAFLNGYHDKDIYVVQLEGFVDHSHPRKAIESNVTYLILYVDDIIIIGNHISSLQSVKTYLGKCFVVKDLGETAFILGIKIYRDRSKRLIMPSQSAYMDKILKRYRMDNSKRGYIPMQEKLDLNKTQGASTHEEVKHMPNVSYASAVGSIMYAVRCTRPDVAFAQNITTELRVDCYCDVGFETDIDDTKSQTGYVFVLNEGAVDWKNSKRFISELGIVPTISEPNKMFCDNSAALHSANEPSVQKGARHHHKRYHYVREFIELGETKLLKVQIDDNPADPFTNALSKGKLTQHAMSARLRLASIFM